MLASFCELRKFNLIPLEEGLSYNKGITAKPPRSMASPVVCHMEFLFRHGLYFPTIQKELVAPNFKRKGQVRP